MRQEVLLLSEDSRACLKEYMKLLIVCVVLSVTVLLIFIGCLAYYHRHCFGQPLSLPLIFGGTLARPPPLFDLWQNEFMALGQQVANTFNLTNCWVCDRPLSLESWPWTAVPISPEWLVSNYSEVKNDSYWGEDTQPWTIQYPVQGEYCLNRTQKGGIPVGNSKCNWTYTYDNHCLTDGCRPIDCSNHGAAVSLPERDDQAYCRLLSSSSPNFVPHWPGWAWVNQTGHRKQFSHFWSSTNQSNNGLNVTCFWHHGSGAWKCRLTDKMYSRLPDGTQILWSSDNKDHCQGHLSIGPDGLPICWGTTEEVGKTVDKLLMNGPSDHPLEVGNSTYF
ncbi:uncharacterized protein LOC128136108 [Harpia harpyja]|uniref:uncharacterized protein LOC128136108 n=1 Tax=Harpia harpyja TaxID=202280 RepID=UPI0022B200A6|nr:uncharacterized protein LOC128136108 [Harpia harpyja]